MDNCAQIIRHPAFVSAEKELLNKLDAAVPGSIHFVAALPGAGKSILCNTVMNKLAGSPSGWGTGRSPIIKVRAANSDRSFYSPKDMQARLNEELHTPRFEWLIARDARDLTILSALKKEVKEVQETWEYLRPAKSENALRRAFERSARERSIRFVFIDQAGSIAFTQRGRHPSEHMYSLMCLAEEIPVSLVLFGTPRIRALWEGNGEIRRRSTFTFLRRYHKTREDMHSFGRLCLTLSEGLNLAGSAKLSSQIDFLYAATLGVFSEIRSHFARAEDIRRASGAKEIAREHLASAALPQSELETLYQDAAALDNMMCETDLAHIIKRTNASRTLVRSR